MLERVFFLTDLVTKSTIQRVYTYIKLLLTFLLEWAEIQENHPFVPINLCSQVEKICYLKSLSW